MSRIKTLLSSRILGRYLALALAGAMVASVGIASQIPPVPDYRVGDRVDADIATPVALVVFDAARTERLRRTEAQKATPIFRFWPAAMQQAESELAGTFRDTRARFAESLERLFGHPLPLLTTELAQPQFSEFLVSFREQNLPFPLTTNLAELWALGDPGEPLLEKLRATLRQFTNSYVRADRLPAGERLVPGLFRLVAIGQPEASLTLAEADRRGRNLSRSNLITVTRIRQNLTRNLRGENLTAARFVAGFIQPNCFFDETLTQQARTRRTEAINAADHYEAGQVIVKRDEVVTEKIRLALDELRTRTEPERAQAALVEERAKAEAQTTRALLATKAAQQSKRRLLIGLGASGAVCLVVFVAWLRRRVVAKRDSLAVAVVGSDPEGEALWRERAMEAEARAEKASALLRANLFPHLARWMMNEVMQRLLSQRSESHTTQHLAEQEVAVLAERLASVHAPLEERMKAYERRIAELEAELAAKGEQNLELIKAKIETTRKKLEGERTDQPLNWN